MKRYKVLPTTGNLLVNTDLHGNFEDFNKLKEIFLSMPDAHWAILGDIVHAPNQDAKKRSPEFYNYNDGSFLIASSIVELQKRFPQRIHFVLGNHDHAHVGGPITRKFFPDERLNLEKILTPEERKLLYDLFESAYLVLFSPSGLSLSHASPGCEITALSELEFPSFAPPFSERSADILSNYLRCYGQTENDSRTYLDSMSKLLGFTLTTVIHGHDRDPIGFYSHENTQFSPVIFGAPNENKRYLKIDLSKRIIGPQSIIEDVEIQHLY